MYLVGLMIIKTFVRTIVYHIVYYINYYMDYHSIIYRKNGAILIDFNT